MINSPMSRVLDSCARHSSKKRLHRRESNQPALTQWWANWWIWVTAAVALFIAFDIYSPSLDAPFVWDDRFQPFSNPAFQNQGLWAWIAGNRPLLMFSFWANYQIGGTNPAGYHILNFLLHFTVSLLIVLILAKLLERAGVEGDRRTVLSIFGGALF